MIRIRSVNVIAVPAVPDAAVLNLKEPLSKPRNAASSVALYFQAESKCALVEKKLLLPEPNIPTPFTISKDFPREFANGEIPIPTF